MRQTPQPVIAPGKQRARYYENRNEIKEKHCFYRGGALSRNWVTTGLPFPEHTYRTASVSVGECSIASQDGDADPELHNLAVKSLAMSRSGGVWFDPGQVSGADIGGEGGFRDAHQAVPSGSATASAR